MTHPTDEQWMAYLYGELDEQRDDALASHLTQCTKCCQQVDRWRQTMAALDTWRLSGRLPINGWRIGLGPSTGNACRSTARWST